LKNNSRTIQEIQNAQREAMLDTVLNGVLDYFASRDVPDIAESIGDTIEDSQVDVGLTTESSDAEWDEVDKLTRMFSDEIISLAHRTTDSLKRRVRNLTPGSRV